MTIIISDDEPSRGPRDALRHAERQDEAILEKLPEIIIRGSIIEKTEKGEEVRIPIDYLEIPDFRHGSRSGEGIGGLGAGQGEGEPGEVEGDDEEMGNNGEGGEASADGSGSLEHGYSIEKLLELWAKKIGLPNRSQKPRTVEFEITFKFRGVKHSGPHSLLLHNKTTKEGLKKFIAYLEILKEESKKDELTCFAALKKAEGDLREALDLLAHPAFTHNEKEIEPFPIIHNEDQRFRGYEEQKNPITQAVLVSMLDVSGSMSEVRIKFIARSIFFWAGHFLKKRYERMVIRFIIHPGNEEPAELVEEDVAIQMKMSGSTYSHVAFDKMQELVDSQYPTDKYDVYGLYVSDGDDFSMEETEKSIKKLLESGVAMLAYSEVQVSMYASHNAKLYEHLVTALKLKRASLVSAKLEYAEGGDSEMPLVAIIIENEIQVGPALTVLFDERRWAKE